MSQFEGQRIDIKDLPPLGTVIEGLGSDYKTVAYGEGYFADAVIVRASKRRGGLKIGQRIAVPYGVLVDDWKYQQEREKKEVI